MDGVEQPERISTQQLGDIRWDWDLHDINLANILGVTQAEVHQWRHYGVKSPSKRLLELHEAAKILRYFIRKSRIPTVVNHGTAKQGNRSLRDLALSGKTDVVLAHCKDMFDFQSIYY